MKFFPRIRTYFVHAIFALPLSLGLTATVASAAPPTATTTLDVCQDTVSGNWMYSGVVAVAGDILRDSSVPKITLSLDDNDRFYPIPSDAIAVNPLLTQNPGY